MDDHGNPKGDMVKKMDINKDTEVIVEERKCVSKETQNVQSANTVASTIGGVHRKSKVTFRAPDGVSSEPEMCHVDTEKAPVETQSLLREMEPDTDEASVVLRETERATTEIRMSLSPLKLSMETPEPSREMEIGVNGASVILVHTRIAIKDTKAHFRKEDHNSEEKVGAPVPYGETEPVLRNSSERKK
jgi:hypothetical protein